MGRAARARGPGGPARLGRRLRRGRGRAGRATRRPVAHLLAAGAASLVEVNATIGAEDRAQAAAEAAAAARAGFGCVKVKVGVGDDAGRLAAVRAAAGPRVAIRVDANGAWSHAG